MESDRTEAGAGAPMRADIRRQPEILTRLLARRDEFLAAGQSWLAPGPGGRLFVIGCGDGLFAARAAGVLAGETANLPWTPTGALAAVLSRARFRREDRAVVISMSGNVDRTVEAALAARDAGVPVLALCNGGGGRLASAADARLSLDIPDLAPFLCGTSTYTGTLLALLLLAAGAAGGPVPVAAFEGAIAVMGDAETAADRAIEGMLAATGPPTGVRFLSAGANAGTADYGAAKLVELCRTPSWSDDLEEFAHSRYWSMPTSDLVVLVGGERALARYATVSADALARLGVVTLAIDTTDAPVPAAAYRVTLAALPGFVAPLAGAVPLQVLAYRMAVATGFDPDRRLHLKQDETRFRVSRLLTRRSLVDTGQ